MVKKKTTGLRVCIAEGCKVSLTKSKVRYALQYCDSHWDMAKQLKAKRQPCRVIDCKNPACEDGYCDKCRPFPADVVPLREDWIQNAGLIKTNSISCCPYCGSKERPTGARMCSICSEQIAAIRGNLMTD